MNRVIPFIDGFNLYHSIARHRPFSNFKWLNLTKLIKCFCTSKDKIETIFYFSAYANWKPERAKRHKHYVKALQLTGVTPIFGEFKNKDKF